MAAIDDVDHDWLDDRGTFEQLVDMAISGEPIADLMASVVEPDPVWANAPIAAADQLHQLQARELSSLPRPELEARAARLRAELSAARTHARRCAAERAALRKLQRGLEAHERASTTLELLLGNMEQEALEARHLRPFLAALNRDLGAKAADAGRLRAAAAASARAADRAAAALGGAAAKQARAAWALEARDAEILALRQALAAAGVQPPAPQAVLQAQLQRLRGDGAGGAADGGDREGTTGGSGRRSVPAWWAAVRRGWRHAVLLAERAPEEEHDWVEEAP